MSACAWLMQMESWSVMSFPSFVSCCLVIFLFLTRVLISRFLTYIALVMLMGKWCLLMLQVHRESLVTIICSTSSTINIRSSLQLEFHELTPGIALLIVVEQVSGKDHVLNHLSIPAACFTHPEISMVGLTEVSYDFTILLFFCLYIIPCVFFTLWSMTYIFYKFKHATKVKFF